MPSRQKKVQRDKALTQSFFNQAGSSDPSRNHATRSLKSDDPNLDESAEIGPGKDSLKCSVIATNHKIDGEMFNTVVSLWKEKFKSLTYAESEMQLAASDSDAVDQTVNEELTLALEQMNEVGAMENQSTPMRTFDLDNLNEVAKKYHGLSKMYKDREEREMADVAKLVGDLAITTRDEQRSPEDRLAAELDIHHLNIYSEITVPLASCLAQIQLFNIEKRFGFVEESYQALSNDDMKRRGEDVLAELPLSFRQKLDNPFELTESAPKPRKTRKKKKLSVDKALVQLQRNCKLAIEEMQNLKKIISDAEKPIELPSVPVSFTYGGVPVPKDIPDNIRRRFFDGQFAYQEVLDLQEELFDLVRHVLGALAAWCSTSHEVWYVLLEAIPSHLVRRSEASGRSSLWEARYAF